MRGFRIFMKGNGDFFTKNTATFSCGSYKLYEIIISVSTNIPHGAGEAGKCGENGGTHGTV